MPPKAAPKKKKKSKKELQAELEKQQEELRKAEEEERKRREEEEKRRIEEEARRREEEERRRIEEADRLETEEGDLQSILLERKEALSRMEEIVAQRSEWLRFLECDHRPSASVERELTAHITTWRESEDSDLNSTLQTAQLTEGLVQELSVLLLKARGSGDLSKVEWCQNYMGQLRAVQHQKLDLATANILQHADEMINAKNELQVSSSSTDLKLGVWSNVAPKGFRIKTIDFGELRMTSDLPKPLASQAVGMRCLWTSFDPVSAQHHCRDMPLGGVYQVELLQMPPPPKKVKGWVMRQVTHLASSLNRIQYPSAEASASASASQPVRLSYNIPPYVLLREEKPRIAVWDARAQRWSEDGVQDCKFDSGTNQVTAQISRLAAVALVQDRFLDFPVQGWTWRPSAADLGTLTLKGKRFSVGLEVCKDGVKLIEPRDRELQHLLNRGYCQPGLLLQELVKCGINLMPDDRDAFYLLEVPIVPKLPELEERAYADIAQVSGAMAVRSSKWSQSRGENKAIISVKEYIDWAAKADEHEGWRSVLYHTNKCSLVQATEEAEECDESRASGDETHAVLALCLEGRLSQEARYRIHSPDHLQFQEVLRSTLRLLRLLSFSS